jgi:hypothetical protein
VRGGGTQRASSKIRDEVGNGSTQPPGSSQPGQSSGKGSPSSAQGGQPGQAGGQPGQSGGAPGAGQPGAAGKGNGQGKGQMPAGGGGIGQQGGGGLGPEKKGPAGNDEPAKDDSQPSPPAEDPKNPFGPADVAPPNGPQTVLSTRNITDALKDASTVKELEDRGFTKEQIDQFTQQFKKPKLGVGRDGREVEVNVGEQPAAAPSADLPVAKNRTFTSDKIRQDKDIAKDTARGNTEGISNEAPREWREKLSNYYSTLASKDKKAAKPRPAAAAKP